MAARILSVVVILAIIAAAVWFFAVAPVLAEISQAVARLGRV